MVKTEYDPESVKIVRKLKSILEDLHGGTTFHIGDISLEITGRDGLGGLIEEWFGQWAKKNGFVIKNPKDSGNSQEFPDYYIGQEEHLLEIKTFDGDRSPNFDLANFESYCESLTHFPQRINSDYIVFSYKLNKAELHITDVWLKKIWEISGPSERYPIKTQVKRGVIYNIRPITWFSKKTKFKAFETKEDFVKALFRTQKTYRGKNTQKEYLSNLKTLKDRRQ